MSFVKEKLKGAGKVVVMIKS